MKRRIFALLCVIALCVPAVCGAGQYWCETCESMTDAVEGKIEKCVEDGRQIEKGEMVCSVCGNQYIPSVEWRRDLGPAPTEAPTATTAPTAPPTNPPTNPPTDPPEENPVTVPSENPTESLPPQGGETTPEVPVTYPPESNPTDSVPPAVVTTPGENTTPSVAPETPMAPPSQPAEVTNPSAATDPPVIIFTDPPVETEVPAPETMMPVIDENTPVPVTNPPEQITTNPPATNVPAAGEYNGRNYRKYPLFSRAFPSRRLNLEGDPDAFAEVPGVCIIENADLQKLLEVAFGI